jgi:hypothetical protein
MNSEMKIISYKEARRCIENIENLEIQMFLKTLYLLAARGCEIAGKIDDNASAYRLTHKIIYGPKGIDVSLTKICLDEPHFTLNSIKDTLKQSRNGDIELNQKIRELSNVSIALFKITNARRRIQNLEKLPKRIVAVPMSEKFEPWTAEVYNYFKEKGDKYVFPFKRQQVWQYLTKNHVFNRGMYRIRKYRYGRNGEIVFDVFAHPRRLKTFGLRYLRSDELMCEYGFDWGDWITYTSAPFEKRNSMHWWDWRRYIVKLCIERQRNA